MDVPREWLRVSLNVSESQVNESAAWEEVQLVLRDFYRDRLNLAVHHLVLVVLYGATFLVAATANTLALIVFCRFQHMRSLSNALLITLAVSDLLVSLVCIPVAIGFLTYKLWVFGEVMCKLVHYLQDGIRAGVAVSSSVFTMTVMSLDRYLVICHPIAFRRHLSRRHTGWSVALVWVLAALLFAPVLVVRKARGILLHAGTDRELSFVYCVEDWGSAWARESFASATFTLVFVVPGATMAAAYCRIGVRLCGRPPAARHDRKQSVSFRIQNIMDRRRLVAKRFLILTTVFAICWVPYNIATLLLDFQESGDVDVHLWTFLPFGLLLGHVNSAINPLLYCWVNRRFRRCVALACRCRRDQVRERRPQDYPMTIAASLRSSSLVWKKSLKKMDSHTLQVEQCI